MMENINDNVNLQKVNTFLTLDAHFVQLQLYHFNGAIRLPS